ncbi:MAG TPA: hypothetical protein VIH88_10380 [Candidatus Acidoferrales bacterium]
MKLRFYDWLVFGLLTVVAISGGSTVALLAVIAGLLYLIVRRYFFVPKVEGIKAEGTTASDPEDIEFVVHNSEKDDVVDRAIIELDVDFKHRPAPGHFPMYSRFDLYSGRSEYEYKVDGTAVSIRLLNSRDDPSPPDFTEDWKVRDGVVLELDIRTRFEAKKFKWGSVDDDIASLKSQTEWQELKSWSFNGFKYFVLNRSLPVPEARRYLRQELERLKLGTARATDEFAAYGLEPDPDTESITGWRWIGGNKPEVEKDMQPFWDTVKNGVLGISVEETGRDGRQLIIELQKLLGE